MSHTFTVHAHNNTLEAIVAALRREIALLEPHLHDAHIVGSEIIFDKWVPLSEITQVCVNIWDHPSQYAAVSDESDDAWEDFLQYLWVTYPDGTEKRLADVAHGK